LETVALKSYAMLSFAWDESGALAKIYRASVLTGDREFESLKREIKIIWI